MVAKRKRNVISRPRRVGKRRVRVARRRPVRKAVKRLLGKRRLPGLVGPRSKRLRVSRRAAVRGGQYSDVTYSKIQYGRKRPVSLRQLLKFGTDYRILRWQAVNNYTISSGTIPGKLDCGITANGTGKDMPVYLICLNQTLGSAGYGPVTRLTVTDEGHCRFNLVSAQAPDGTATTQWCKEYENNTGNQGSQERYIHQAWYDIRMKLYGSKSVQTRYDIMLVSFAKDRDPYSYNYPPGIDLSATGGPQVAERNLMWQQFVRTLVTNPVIPADYSQRRERQSGMRVWKRWSYKIGSGDAQEFDNNPHAEVVKLFIPDGRTYDYWTLNDSQDMTYPVAVDRDSTLCDSTTWNNKRVAPDSHYFYDDWPAAPARKYLIIRATDPSVSFATSAAQASFDLMVRKKEIMRSQ